MKIGKQIVESVVAAIESLYGQTVDQSTIQLSKTKKEFEGHLTLVVFPFLKISKKNPEQTANEIGEYLTANAAEVTAFNVIKGFLNLTISPAAWIELHNDIFADENFGFKAETEDSPLVMIEYSSPNTNKPLHLGHIRNNLLGFSISDILKAS